MNITSIFKINGSVVITGAAGLLGKQHAKAVIEHGGIPILLDINIEELKKFQNELSESGHNNLLVYECDITKKFEVEKVLLDAVSKNQKIVGLVNNAALNPVVKDGLEDVSMLESFNLDIWDKELEVGIKGSLICTMVFGAHMAENNYGSIVNISSDLGVISPDQRLYKKNGKNYFKPVTYSVIKHALIGLTKYTTTYWNENGVRANTLIPGGVENSQDKLFIKKVSQLIPLGRMAKEDEYKGALVYLLSDASSYMTGASLVVDGGRTSW